MTHDWRGIRSQTQDSWRSQSSTFAPPVEKTVKRQADARRDLRPRVNYRSNSAESWRSQSASFQPDCETPAGGAYRTRQFLCTPVGRAHEVKATWAIPAAPSLPGTKLLERPKVQRLASECSVNSKSSSKGSRGHSPRSRSWDSLNIPLSSSAKRTRSWDSLALDQVPREGNRKEICATALAGAVARKLEQQINGANADPADALDTTHIPDKVSYSKHSKRRMSVPAIPAKMMGEMPLFVHRSEGYGDVKMVSDALLTEEEEELNLRRARTWPEFGAVTGCLDELLQEDDDVVDVLSPRSLHATPRKSTKRSMTQEELGAKPKKPKGGDNKKGPANFLRWRFLRSMSKASSLGSAATVSRFFFRRARSTLSSLSSQSVIREWLWWSESVHNHFSQDGHDIRCCWRLVLFASIMILGAAITLLLTDIAGSSMQIYLPLIRSEEFSMPVLAAAFIAFVILHVTDVYSWKGRTWKRLTPIICMFYLACVGVLFMTKSYPEIPLIVSFLHFPIWIGGLRIASSGYWASYSFHVVFAFCCGLAGVSLLIVWVIWMSTDDNWQRLTEKRLQEDMQRFFQEYDVVDWEQCVLEREQNQHVLGQSLLENCSRIELFAFLSWTCPALEASVLLSIAVFLRVRSYHLRSKIHDRDKDVEMQCTKSESDEKTEDKSLRRIMLVVFVFIGAAWSAGAIAGSSMGLTNTVFLLLGSGGLVMFIWLLGSIRLVDVIKKTHKSMLWKILRPFARSDWTKAFALCCTALFVAAFLALECFTRLLQRLFGMKKGPLKYTTTRGAWLIGMTSDWHMTSVLSKAWWLSMLFLLIWVVCTKVALVLLSWMIDYSKEYHWISVLGLFYGVALSLFLLPTMPVVPIYMSAGILIVARLREEIGFVLGVIAACGLCLVLKLNACACQQKLFGQGLGNFTTVKRIVGLHTVATRAVELILQQPGFSLAKVAILVGGPDWPTSVLTGIMGLRLSQMLLGTTPVIFLILPTVLAGSCLLDDEVKKFSPMVTGIMGIAHGSTFIAALVLTARVAMQHHEVLRQPREEHKDLEEMAKIADRRRSRHAELSSWGSLRWTQRSSLSLAVSLVFLSCWITTLQSSRCFRSFGLDSEINATFEEGGLNRNAWNLLKPLGYFSCGLILAGIACYTWYSIESLLLFCSERGHEDSTSVSDGGSEPGTGVAENVFSPRSSNSPHEDVTSPLRVDAFEDARPGVDLIVNTPPCTPPVVSPRADEPLSPRYTDD